MEDKYYKPQIEEFHIGFEYEWMGVDGTWRKEDSPTEITKKGFDDQLYGLRVKYLDREDIESLGFIKHNIDGDTECYWINSDAPYFRRGDRLIVDPTMKNHYFIEASSNYFNNTPVQMFSGFIKNKSELKRLLIQLGINK